MTWSNGDILATIRLMVECALTVDIDRELPGFQRMEAMAKQAGGVLLTGLGAHSSSNQS